MRSQRRAVTLCQATGTSLRRPQRRHSRGGGSMGRMWGAAAPTRLLLLLLVLAGLCARDAWAMPRRALGAGGCQRRGQRQGRMRASRRRGWGPKPPRGPCEPSHAPRCPGSSLPLRREVPEPRRSLGHLAPCPGPSVTAGCSGAQRARGTCLLSACFQVTMRSAALPQLLSWVLEWSSRGSPAVSCHRPLPPKQQHWSAGEWRSCAGRQPPSEGSSAPCRGQPWLQHVVEALLTCPGPHLCPQAVLFQLPRGILLARLGGTPQVRGLRCRSRFPWGLLVAFCAS